MMGINYELSTNAKTNIIVYAVIGGLLTSGIIVIDFMDIFSQNWFIGVGLLFAGIGTIAMFIVTKIKK